jgi:hypothetical protein
MFIGYSGHRVIGILPLTLVVILASWRFWDHTREKEIDRCHGSGELNPEHDHWADLKADDDAAGGDAGSHE